ncbi:MAG: Hsp20/alpha crystallin family protein [Alphaproteobacteria bacterium]|nr:Hsp20/alpha crystallin family protein [Alphaproteobacteria bacterium]
MSKTKRWLVPAVDVFESDEAWKVVADVPHVHKDELEVTVHEGVLKIRAEGETVGYERSFRMPANVVTDTVDAGLEGGVLTLTIPKPAEVRPHRIAIA